ncbi:glycoside hydrolase family 32 protein [Demequina sp.]|uniref:glycoside hydrolase family 32 protein n=1 Tax=Demequina sp. TaxID=2050685 RepID=UPI0025F2E44C|nr:glycoside hydrolase family 32 protein [Demequina sp.]
MPDHFPHLHTRPATGWVNDPNGIGFWDGQWHVMMQWNPNGTGWGDIHWAHLSSPDLLHWTEERPGLTPRPGTIDAGGAWSGVAATDDDGRIALIYSATPAGPDEVGVAIARLAPGTQDVWEQPDAMTLPHPDGPGFKDVRDPFLFHHEGRRLALQGSRIDDHGAVLLFDVEDLDDWKYLGTLLSDHEVGDPIPREPNFWECPQLVRVGDRWVLVVSWCSLGEATVDSGARAVAAWAGDLVADGDGYRFVPETSAALDHGEDFYAPQLVEAEGRALAWGWSWDGHHEIAADRPEADVVASGWAGTMTFPREVALDDAGVPVLRPAPELAALKAGALPVTHEGAGRVLTTDEAAWAATVDAGWSLVLEGPDGVRDVLGPDRPAGEVWVDGSIVEVFDAAGSTTVRAYPADGETWVLISDGAIAAHRLALPA